VLTVAGARGVLAAASVRTAASVLTAAGRDDARMARRRLDARTGTPSPAGADAVKADDQPFGITRLGMASSL
jgi:hypothetical protein